MADTRRVSSTNDLGVCAPKAVLPKDDLPMFTDNQFVFPEEPSRLYDITTTKRKKITVPLMGEHAGEIGHYDKLVKHTFLVFAATTRDNDKIIDMALPTKLLWEDGLLSLDLVDSKGYASVDLFVLDLLATNVEETEGYIVPSGAPSLTRVEGTPSHDVVWAATNYGDRCFLFNYNDVDYLTSVVSNGGFYDVSALDVRGAALYRGAFLSAETPLTSILGNPQYRIDLDALPENVGGLAEPYYPARTYIEDEVVLYEGSFYRCLGLTTGDWDATKWRQLTFGYILQRTIADQSLDITSDRPISNKAVTQALEGKVDKTTKVNGKPLSHDVDLQPEDVHVEAVTNEEIDDLFR